MVRVAVTHRPIAGGFPSYGPQFSGKGVTMILRSFFCLFLSSFVLLASGQSSPVFEEIVRKYLAACKAIRTYDTRFTEDPVFSNPPKPGQIDDIKSYTQIASDEKLFRSKTFINRRSKEVEQHFAEIFNGEYQYVMRPPKWEKGKPELSILDKKSFEPLMGPEQVYKKVAGLDQITFDQIFSVMSEPKVVPEKDSFLIIGTFDISKDRNGDPYPVKGTLVELKVWISREIYLPIKYEFSSMSGKTQITQTVSDIEYRRFGDAFFPVSAKRYIPSFGVVHHYQADVEHTRVNVDIPAETFVPKLEPGTFVWDYVMNTQYLFMPESLVDLTLNQAVVKRVQQSDANTTPSHEKKERSSEVRTEESGKSVTPVISPQQAPDERKMWKLFLSVGLGCGAAVLLLLLLWRRKQA